MHLYKYVNYCAGMHTCKLIKLFLHITMQWLKDEFLQWLKDWENNVKERQGFTPAQQNMMLLSRETREGLQMAGIYSEIFN